MLQDIDEPFTPEDRERIETALKENRFNDAAQLINTWLQTLDAIERREAHFSKRLHIFLSHPSFRQFIFKEWPPKSI